MLGVGLEQRAVAQLVRPPTSKWREGPSYSSAPTSASSTSTVAIGWTMESIQVGMVCTGMRSLTCRMISNEVDPLPSSTAARSTTTVAGVSLRIRSTSRRDVMCSERSSSATSGTTPDR